MVLEYNFTYFWGTGHCEKIEKQAVIPLLDDPSTRNSPACPGRSRFSRIITLCTSSTAALTTNYVRNTLCSTVFCNADLSNLRENVTCYSSVQNMPSSIAITSTHPPAREQAAAESCRAYSSLWSLSQEIVVSAGPFWASMIKWGSIQGPGLKIVVGWWEIVLPYTHVDAEVASEVPCNISISKRVIL